jgi:hypothetical protein
MRVLFNNLLNDDMTLSATNESTNYPVERVYNNTLESVFKSTGNASVITAEFTEDKTVSCFAFGNHNIDTITITLFDSLDVSLGSYSYDWYDLVFDSEYTENMIYVIAIGAVRKITFDIIGLTSPLYLGGLAVGQYYQFPYPDADPSISFPTTSSLDQSDYGIGFEQDGNTLEEFECSWDMIPFTKYYDAIDFIKTVQTNKIVWLDRWEGDSLFRVLFCSNNSDSPELKKGETGMYFSGLTLNFRERK